MTEALCDILNLFASSFYGSLVVGMICPVIGVFFVLRRVVFLGIAVPQFAAAGVAFGFVLLPLLGGGLSGGDIQAAAGGLEGHFTFHLFFAMAFTFLALFLLALLGRKGTGSPESRIAALRRLLPEMMRIYEHAPVKYGRGEPLPSATR